MAEAGAVPDEDCKYLQLAGPQPAHRLSAWSESSARVELGRVKRDAARPSFSARAAFPNEARSLGAGQPVHSFAKSEQLLSSTCPPAPFHTPCDIY